MEGTGGRSGRAEMGRRDGCGNSEQGTQQSEKCSAVQ